MPSTAGRVYTAERVVGAQSGTLPFTHVFHP